MNLNFAFSKPLPCCDFESMLNIASVKNKLSKNKIK